MTPYLAGLERRLERADRPRGPPRGRAGPTRARAPRAGARGRRTARRAPAARPRRSGGGRPGRRRSRGRRGPCGRPGGGPGSRAGRRSTTSPQQRARRRSAGGRRPGPSSGAIVGLELRDRRQVSGRGRDPVLGELADALARPGSGRRCPRPPQTESMSTPSDARRVEHGRARREPAAAARRREDDERLSARPVTRRVGASAAPAADAPAVDPRRPASPSGGGSRCGGSSGRSRGRCPSGRRPP